MERTTSTAVLAAAIFAALSAPATAGSWTGCHLGIQGGYALADHAVSVPGYGSLDGISGDGFQGGPVIGCDAQLFDRFVVGAFADYSFRDVETSFSFGGSSGSVALEDAWSVGARAGILINPATLVYGLIAYHHSDVNDLGSGFVSDLHGIAGGGGIETEIASGWALRGEYRYVAYDDKSVGGVADLDSDEHQVRAALVWRFGGASDATTALKIQP